MGELGTGMTRAEVDVKRREQRGARVPRYSGSRIGEATAVEKSLSPRMVCPCVGIGEAVEIEVEPGRRRGA
ncbi:Os06g0569700 [Oryza sativa Japonica Group]|jgi:hypothetical protein|uniref:Os06g0569700 protein n=1 Tax=Oryza sativa subsp. japonica TaxID=39947 RepID=A0A0P0WXZ7_ORYSJ|nr:Os06g0569700 [Oryza sativa Japonica Group]